MLIKEVDFKKINQHRNTNVIPVFMQYGNECYEIATDKKQAENSWPIFQKLFYYRFYLEKKEYLDSLFEERLFSNANSRGAVIFSKSDKTFHNEISADRDTASKFGKDAYICVFKNKYNNLVVLKKMVNDSSLRDFRLFVTTTEEIENPEFKKEYSVVKKQFVRKKKSPFSIKKGNLVVGHINGIVLNDQEKLIKYTRDEFKKRNLLGDIVLSEAQENTLNSYMAVQLERFIGDPSNFNPEYSRVFALGLVRYAMKHYNTRGTGDFWPYFKSDFNVSITGNNQKYIHSLFEKIMKSYDLIYSDNVAQKIDNLTMHSFVADHSANQLFDYLFDFWRLDLGRNSDNLNFADKGGSSFDTLIDAMRHGTQDVMTHTSLLLNFNKTKPAFKNRIKRIIRLMNDAFWNDSSVIETGNRINHLMNEWISNPKGAFQKEKTYVAKHSSKEKGDILFHSPVFNIDYQNETLKIILPHQRLIDCNEEDHPAWTIKCSSNEFKPLHIPANEHYKHDKIGCYVERMTVEIPLHLVLSEFEFELANGATQLKKYRIHASHIRFFDERGKYIDHKNASIPAGYITAYSDSVDYPEVLGEHTDSMKSDGLILKCFNLTKGQIVTLEDKTGLQIGQKLTEGLNKDPISGVNLTYEGVSYKIHSELPKLLFKAVDEELSGISLVINGKQNKVIDKTISEFKISSELKNAGYLIDMNDYISSEGLYQITLVYPKSHRRLDIGAFAYIKGFDYKFLDAPYVFEDYGKITFTKESKIDKRTKDKDGIWESNFSGDTFSFNFGERKSDNEGYCGLIEENRLVLDCIVDGKKCSVHFEIPALYWKFALDEEWNTRQPANILLKELKSKIKNMYVAGPFNFSKSAISTADDIDIAEEESEIRLSSGKSEYFEIGKAYNWFKNDRSKTHRELYLTLDSQKIDLLDVVCRSSLKGVSLIGDFENNRLEGILDIEGDEDYTVSIYHNGETVCEDEQVVDKKFSIDAKLETGDYEIFVYEIAEDDEEGGFDVGAESIPLNSMPIIKRLVNLGNLEGRRIVVRGYQDINKKYMPRVFTRKYHIVDLKRISYSQFLKEEPDCEIYGIWNDKIDRTNETEMNGYIIYRGSLGVYRFDDSFHKLMNVLAIYTDKMKPESILLLAIDADGSEYGSLEIDKSKGCIVPGHQYKQMSKFEQRKCGCFYDDQYFYITEIEEA